MESIRSTTPGFTPAPSSTPNEIKGEAEQIAAGALSNVQSAKLASNLVALAKTLNTQNPQGTPGVTNSNGAPELDGVTIQFSPEDLAAALQVLQGKTQDAQLKTAKEGIEGNRIKQQAAHAEALKKIQEAIKAAEEASAKAKASGILGWIGKIAAFVAAVVGVVVAGALTAISGGAAAPLLAVATIGLVAATMTLASAISQAAGGPALEPSAWMPKLISSALQAMGVDKEKADAAGKMMSGVIGIATGLAVVDPALAGNTLEGFVKLVGGSDQAAAITAAVTTAIFGIGVSIALAVASGGTNIAGSTAQTIKTVSAIVTGGIQVAAGGAQAAAGGVNIAKAVDENRMNLAMADKKTFDAAIMQIAKNMEDEREELKKIIQQIQDGMQVVTQMISAGAQNRDQISKNIGGGKSAMA